MRIKIMFTPKWAQIWASKVSAAYSMKFEEKILPPRIYPIEYLAKYMLLPSNNLVAFSTH